MLCIHKCDNCTTAHILLYRNTGIPRLKEKSLKLYATEIGGGHTSPGLTTIKLKVTVPLRFETAIPWVLLFVVGRKCSPCNRATYEWVALKHGSWGPSTIQIYPFPPPLNGTLHPLTVSLAMKHIVGCCFHHLGKMRGGSSCMEAWADLSGLLFTW